MRDATRADGSGGLRRLWTVMVRRIAIDPRGLAALRIALGGVLLADLLLRARNLTAFYTDAGVLPRAVLRRTFPGFAEVSIHALSGSLWAQAALFAIAAVAAGAVLLGYRTRLAIVLSWVLLVSLHARNPVVVNAGDSLLRRLLLWGAFLPLGSRWSLDAVARDRRVPDRFAGPAAAGLLLQVVVVYVVNGLFKLRGDRWLAGTAIRYVFGIDHLTVWFGDALAGFPSVLVAFDRLWLGMTLTAWLLIVLTGRTRSGFAALFIGMHAGMFLTMRLGLFPLISIASLLPFLHGGVWDALEALVRPRLDRLIRPAALPKWLPAGPQVPDAFRPSRRLRGGVIGGLIVVMLVWNAATLGYVGLPEPVAGTVDPDAYRWDMFAPEPRMTDGWYVMPGRLPDGGRVDAFDGGAVTWDRPPDTAASFPTHRWFVYLLELQRPAGRALRPAFAGYLCRRFAARHDRELTGVAVYYIEQPVRLDGRGPTRRVLLANRTCGP